MFEAASLALLVLAQSPDACEAIVGSDDTHVDNKAARQARIASILQDEDYVAVIAYEHIDEPEAINLRGIDLVSADIDSGVATIRIEDDADLPCPGEHEFVVDDALGRDFAVRAVLDDAVLLERDGSLVYVSSDSAQRFEWSMVWRSRFSVVPNKTGRKKHVRRRAKANRKRARARARKR